MVGLRSQSGSSTWSPNHEGFVRNRTKCYSRETSSLIIFKEKSEWMKKAGLLCHSQLASFPNFSRAADSAPKVEWAISSALGFLHTSSSSFPLMRPFESHLSSAESWLAKSGGTPWRARGSGQSTSKTAGTIRTERVLLLTSLFLPNERSQAKQEHWCKTPANLPLQHTQTRKFHPKFLHRNGF